MRTGQQTWLLLALNTSLPLMIEANENMQKTCRTNTFKISVKQINIYRISLQRPRLFVFVDTRNCEAEGAQEMGSKIFWVLMMSPSFCFIFTKRRLNSRPSPWKDTKTHTSACVSPTLSKVLKLWPTRGRRSTQEVANMSVLSFRSLSLWGLKTEWLKTCYWLCSPAKAFNYEQDKMKTSTARVTMASIGEHLG